MSSSDCSIIPAIGENNKNPWFQTTNQVMFAYRIWLTLDILQTTFLGRKSSIRRGAYFGAASLWLSNT
jgi:hypothetical protein